MRARHLYVDGVHMGRCGANKGIAIITLAAAVFGWTLGVFEVSALNVDAVCRQSVIDESGVSNFNLTMFTLERADGTPIEGRFFNGSQVDGLEMHNGGDGSNRAWVEQGESATYRIACVLSADVDKDTEYKVNCCGAIDQDAPTVYLGKAVFV